MGTMVSQITSPTIVYSTVSSDAIQRKQQSSAALAFVWGTHRLPVNSPHKWPVTQEMFPFDDVIIMHQHSDNNSTTHAVIGIQRMAYAVIDVCILRKPDSTAWDVFY